MAHTLAQMIKQLREKKVSSRELVEQSLAAIKSQPSLNAFIYINEEDALKQATIADKQLAAGRGGALCGVPMAHKDLFCTKGMPTTCGSKMLENFIAPYDATIVSRLADAGAICVGKTNMDEFAMGSGNETSYFGAVKNPWDLRRVAGGSSGGSACAVAADMVSFTTGSDTGGSIRLPAAFCGISGLKPTYGLVSRFGMTAHASSLDQAGPMARSAEDLALVLQHMAGVDAKDATSMDKAIPDYHNALKRPMKKLCIGLPRAFFGEAADAKVLDTVMQAARFFEQHGAELVDIDLALHKYWIPCYYVIASAEASSNLSRFDGVRYGHRSAKAPSIREMTANSRQEGFGLEVKRRIFTGAHVLSSGYIDACYIHAMKVRRLIQQELFAALSKVDILLGPTSPTGAFLSGQQHQDPIRNYLADTYTVAASLAGLPALSIPVGFAEKLPVGLQLIGHAFGEATLLNLAHFYQQHSDWHLARARR